jgi:hypothetical protein
MSSTTGVQNALANVLRPYYTYDPLTAVFRTRLEMSNIDTYYGTAVTVGSVTFGDSNENIYIGSNAGSTQVGLGGSNNIALGYQAATNLSNTLNSVFLGYNAAPGAVNVSNTVAVGANTVALTGVSNVYVGTGTGGTSGDSNVFVGASNTGTGSNMILIGTGLAGGSTNNIFRLGSNYLYGNQSTKWLGIGTPTASSAKLDVSGATQSSLGFSSTNGTLSLIAPGLTANIATLRKGTILVTAQDTASTSHYQSIQVFCPDPTNGSSTVAMTNAVQAGQITILFESGGSNIRISNATTQRNIGWTVTYFPLP